jgi:hypoxanthine phosphoribosyltransferase
MSEGGKPKLEVLLPEQRIRERVAAMGAEISKTYGSESLTVIGVLNGSFIFMADLVRQISSPVRCEFLGLSSYGSATESSGVVAITKDLGSSIAGQHVLVVEDIIDTGLTMKYLLENLATRHPASVRVASLLSKPARRQVEARIDFLGFTIEDRFVVGYGLDYAGLYRNLPYIGVLAL